MVDPREVTFALSITKAEADAIELKRQIQVDANLKDLLEQVLLQLQISNSYNLLITNEKLTKGDI